MTTRTRVKKSAEQGSRLVQAFVYAWVILGGTVFGFLGLQQLQGNEPLRGVGTLAVGGLVLGAAWLMRRYTRDQD